MSPYAVKLITPKLAFRVLKQVKLGTIMNFSRNYWKHHKVLEEQKSHGILKPTIMRLELTTLEKNDPAIMKLDVAREAVKEGREMGIGRYEFVGGEPMIKKTLHVIETILEENPKQNFHICTDARLLSTQENELNYLVKKNNIIFSLRLDGFENIHDAIRGKDSFQQVMLSAEYLAEWKCLFGANVTVKNENISEVTTDKFINHLILKGFTYVRYSVSQETKLFFEYNDKPILIYTDRTGTNDSASTKSQNTIIYVNNDGTLSDN